MAITRSKIRKTRNALKPCPQASTTDSDHQLTSSAARIGSSDDILTEILLRLPVIFILKFKSVSKHWEWLLSQPHFTLRHDKLQISPGLFVRNNYIPFDVEDRSPPLFRILDFCSDLNGVKIVQSCNGLLLCCSDRGRIRDRKYYVVNPTTKQFAIVPPVPGGDNARNMICFVGLAFHQETCPHYKVVCIVSSNITKPDPLEYLSLIQIYSSETREWKTNNHFCSHRYSDFRNGVYWNGAIYWPSVYNPWYFDLNIEKLQDLPLPLSMRENCFPPIYFGESRGHLHLMDTVGHGSDTYLIMYEMSADHSEWFVKYTVELHKYDIPFFHPHMINSYWRYWRSSNCPFEVLDVVRDEKEEDAFIVLKILQSIVRYNLRDNSFQTLFNMTDESLRSIYKDAHRYIQSLTSF
ncbi:F-box protein At5g07610-like [Bidens hawaiensis]|uniref:F-box protein At5g07610-like n=1 Tax=Bidens hawaiensis TaxID=980011 RepID=UPI00404B027E